MVADPLAVHENLKRITESSMYRRDDSRSDRSRRPRRRPWVWVGLAVLVCLTVSPAPADDAGGADFVPLFNGRDFTGWRFGDSSAAPKEVPAAWKVADGSVVGVGDPGAILASQWDYEDFEFEFEWRAADASFDADLYVHGGRLLEADPIRMAKGLEGGPQETDRGEGGYNAGPKGQIGGGGTRRKAVPELQRPVGEWNTWRIVAEGDTFSLFCNGQLAWENDDHAPRRGYLGFRVFNGPMEFRNLKLREIGYRGLMDMAEWEVYPGYGGDGPLDKHWTRDGDGGRLWVFKGPGPSLVTKKKDYTDYRLRAEFLFADPDPAEINTGIYLRGVHPWQAEVWEHKWGSGLWGVLHGHGPAGPHNQNMGKAIRPDVRMDNPPGQWNYLEVRVEDNVVSMWLNGRTIIDRYPIKKVDPKFPDAGGIGLQAHWPWKEIRFHNLRVKAATPEETR